MNDGREVKCADIDDDHVIELASAWRFDASNLGVVAALVEEGIPEKVALRKVEKLCDRGELDYGVSPYYAWPA